MKQEELKAIASTFAKANNKDGFMIVSIANILGVSDKEITDYLKPELSPAQLFEMLAGIRDGISSEVLNLFISKSDEMNIEEMKQIRVKYRNDVMFDILSEGIQKCDEMLEQRLPDAETISVLKTSADRLEGLEKKISELIKDNTDKEEPLKVENKNVEKKPEADGREEAMEAANKSGFVHAVDYVTFVGDEPVVIEKEPVRDDKGTKLKLFRAVNRDKIVPDEKRAKEVKKALSLGLSGKQLEALIRAVKKGVSADFIKYYTKKDVEPERLDKITELYLALYNPNIGIEDMRKVVKK